MVWMTTAEALDVLNVRPQTLYANVSRGKIRARADDADPRRSLYHRDDVLRMARRANGRRKVETVSSEAMQYGDPVLPSAISTAASGRLLYRGHNAAALAEHARLEDIAALLWECPSAEAAALWPPSPIPSAPDTAANCEAPSTPSAAKGTQRGADTGADADAPGHALAASLLALARRSAVDAPSLGRPAAELRAEAAQVLDTLVDAIAGSPDDGHDTGDAGGDGIDDAGGDCDGGGGGGGGDGNSGRSFGGTVSQRLARAWNAEPHEDLIRRALVLMADNELNASTFATRVAISTGASLAAGVLAGFTTLTGPRHGGAAREFAQLIAAAEASNPDHAIQHWLASQRPLPAFGHPLYSEGDPRAQALLHLLPEIQPHTALAHAAARHAGELPNIDYALSVLTTACGLPADAPFILFATGRCVGWLAHALEQVQANRLIRPRARYTGPTEINAGIY